MTDMPHSQDLSAQHPGLGLCCALLRGERRQWPVGMGVAEWRDLLLFHGVDCLIYRRLDLLTGCPAALHEQLRSLAVERAAWELRSLQLLRQALVALQSAGIKVLVLKGSALAYSVYDNPVCRTRSDSDLLIEPGAFEKAASTLAGLGYVAGSRGIHQQDFTITTPDGNHHAIDLHETLTESEALGSLLPFVQLQGRAQVLPALGPTALALSAVDALLFACLHRHLHHQAHYRVRHMQAMTGDRLIWLCDIDLLARSLTPQAWQQLRIQACEMGIAQTCRDDLALVQRMLATPLPQDWQEGWQTGAAITDRYLQAGALRRLWLDWQACKGWGGKLAFSRHLLLPSPDYMRDKYAGARWQWLPWLYLRRAAEGLLARLSSGRPA